MASLEELYGNGGSEGEEDLHRIKRPSDDYSDRKEMDFEDIKDAIATIIGIIAIAGFAVFTGFVFVDRDADEKTWARNIYLLTGVEAVAFAATGYFFGKEVHRERAEKAEDQIDIANQEATDANQEATKMRTKGEALRKFTEIKVSKIPNRNAVYGPLGLTEASALTNLTKVDLEEINDYARELFPDTSDD